MQPLRIALETRERLEGLLADPNRGVTWELVDRDDGPDYVVATDGESTSERVLSIRENVLDALLTGDAETRSSIYLGHALLLLGPVYPIAHMAYDARDRGDADFLTDYAALHRRWMIATSWSEMVIRAIELLAAGTPTIVGDVVWFDGAPGPCRFGESPRECHDPEAMVSRGIPRSCPFIG